MKMKDPHLHCDGCKERCRMSTCSPISESCPIANSIPREGSESCKMMKASMDEVLRKLKLTEEDE